MKSPLAFTFILSLTFIISCGKERALNDFSATSSSIIVGDLQWSEVTALSGSSEEAQNALGVGHVDIPFLGSRCTGFLINENTLMTNHHCIRSEKYAVGVTVSFDVIAGVRKGSEERFDCSGFIGNNQELDFALLRCSGSPGTKYGVVKLQKEAFAETTSVYVIQQNCDYYSQRDCYHTKKISRGQGQLSGARITHNADTLGGSSGSPVFSSSTHQVVGIHHAGFGNNGQGRGFENYAVSMTKIMPYLAIRFPSIILEGVSGSSQPLLTARDNNTMDGATLLGRFKRIDGAIDKASDVDYFEFEVTDGDQVSIDLKIKSLGVDLDIYLIKRGAGVLGKSESVTSVEEITRSLTPGKYFVLVKGYKGAVGNYTLTVR